MKKILAALLVLALAIPAMADVAVTGTDLGGGHLQIKVAPTGGAAVRGVALKLTRTAGDATINATTDATVTEFNTMIDYAFSNAGYTIGMVGQHPLANPAAAGVLDLATPQSEFSLCAGYLDQSGGKAGVVVDSFFDVFFDISIDSTFTVVLDPIRGGIVGDTLGTVTVQSPMLVGGNPPETISTPTLVKAINPGFVNTDLTSITASATSSLGHAVEYSFDWGSGAGAYGAAAQTNTYAFTAAGNETVIVTARCIAHPSVVSSASVPMVLVRECLKTTSTGYAAWKGTTWNRPACWCFKKQCNGDSDGVVTGPYRVGNPDLQKLILTISKTDAVVAGVANGICADFDHTNTGPYRVGNPDLLKLLQYISKVDALVPTCAAATYNFYTN